MTQTISVILQKPQKFVDKIGMYRIVSATLVLLAIISIISGLTGLLAASAAAQVVSLAVALSVALSINFIAAALLRISANHESAVITAIILFFLFRPNVELLENWALAAAVAIGILSKFLLTYRKQHIFNAAAFGAVALSLPGFYEAGWWVSNPTLFIPVLILGSLVVLKVRKWTPVLWFIGVGLIVFLFESWRFDQDLWQSFQTYWLSWPTLFLAFYMLTEPFTMPPTKKSQAFYGGLVGALSNTAVFLPIFTMSPELALVIGNIVAYPFRLRQKLFLKLKERREIAKDTYEFIFEKPAGVHYASGQYLEWMLPHKSADSRGERRYFTVASSPTEDVMRLALKVVPEGSTYKKQLMQMDIGETVIASQLAGDFLLPKDSAQKLGFLAGGIGVTPFSSHIRYMLDSDKAHDTKLFYCSNTLAELAYSAEFAEAAKVLPLEVIPVIAKEPVSHPAEAGFLTEEMLKRRVPDFAERTWYISGPPPMVDAYTKLLLKAGVPRGNLVRDFFPGLA